MTTPEILTPREQLVDSGGKVTRSWWRAFNALFENSGKLASPLTVDGSAILNAATLTSGGTISSPDIPARTLIGNAGAAAAQPAVVEIGSSLATNNGTIDVLSVPPGVLLGNPGSVTATPSPIAVGANLILSAGVLSANSTNSDDQTLAYSIRDTRGQAATLERKVAEAMTMAMLQTSPRSVGGATPTPTPTPTAIYAPLVNGDLPGPTLLADPFGQCVMVEIT